MIKVINKNSEEKEKINYRHLGNFCNSCGNKGGSNLLIIRQDGGTIINLCDKCLQELKKKIEDLEEDD